MYVKKFILSKFAGLQTYSRQFYHQMNSFKGIFDSILSPHAPHVLTEASPHQILKSPPQWGRGDSCPHVLNTCGKPCSYLPP